MTGGTGSSEPYEAEIIVQPEWTEKFLAALSCKGSGLSDAELVDYANKESVILHIRKPAVEGGLR